MWTNEARHFVHANRKTLSLALAIIVIVSSGLAAAIPAGTSASETNLILNGSFEHPFVYQEGCGTVGSGWNCFTNGGVANFGFYDDQWELVVADGEHSQLIEINTKGMAAADADRYAGLSQTVRVKPHAKYTFSMRGIIRTTNLDAEDAHRYVVEVGYVESPNAHWKDVDNWTNTGWTNFSALDKPEHMAGFSTTFVPDHEVITLFIRVWKKWGVPNQELDVNIDDVRLEGPAIQPNAKPGPSGPSAQAIVVDPPHPTPGGVGGACVSTDFIFNGDFENGFIQSGYGTVGRGWGSFTNGGAANYGFYDEQWEAVISMANRGKKSSCQTSNDCFSTRAISVDCGRPAACDCDTDDECAGHGQLIEINTKDHWPADADRYAGIYQQIGGLTPGAPYTLRLRGLLRGTGDETDKYRFAAQVGYNTGMDTNWRNVEEWVEMDLGPIYPRTEPAGLGLYEVTFRAPSNQMVLFIRAWNKWAFPDVELDFNLDDISLTGCGTPSVPACGQAGQPSCATGGPGAQWAGANPGGSAAICTHTVSAGESLGIIANRYGADVNDLVRANQITNPDFIYAGQELTIPGCQDSSRQTGPMNKNPQIMQPLRPAETPQRAYDVGPMIAEADRPVPVIRAAISPSSARAESALAAVAGPTQITSRTYTVRAGQSLGQIAVENGVDPYALATANGITNMDFVYVGQQLRIP